MVLRIWGQKYYQSCIETLQKFELKYNLWRNSNWYTRYNHAYTCLDYSNYLYIFFYCNWISNEIPCNISLLFFHFHPKLRLFTFTVCEEGVGVSWELFPGSIWSFENRSDRNCWFWYWWVRNLKNKSNLVYLNIPII